MKSFLRKKLSFGYFSEKHTQHTGVLIERENVYWMLVELTWASKFLAYVTC